MAKFIKSKFRVLWGTVFSFFAGMFASNISAQDAASNDEAEAKAEETVVEKEEIEFIDLKAEIALKAINQLSPAYRSVFNLFVMEDYTHREIAEILGISEGTSKSNLSKAKINLQRTLNEEFKKIN